MSLIVGANAVVGSAVGGYQIERSLRFNSADTAYLNRTFGTATDRKKWTLSVWVKFKNKTTSERQVLLDAGAQSMIGLAYGTDWAGFHWYDQTAGTAFYGTRLYRDPSAWTHIFVVYDSTQATAIDRIKVYANNVQDPRRAGDDIALNAVSDINSANAHSIGRSVTYSQYLDGYLTEYYFIDGQALTPSDFGEYNETTGVWQPIEYTGTYGNNGFYLNFSDNASTTTLGDDLSGNGNDWSTSGFSVTAGVDNDSLVDTPTSYGTDTGAGGEVRGNYCTFNAVKPVTNSITFSNGNLQYKPGSSWSTTTYVEGTIGVVGGNTGKFYWEMSADQAGNLWTAGVALQNNTIGGSQIGTTGSVMIYYNAKYVNGTSTSSYLTSLSANEVLGVALDAATGKIWFRDSGGWLGSGDPAAGTNETGIPTGFSGATLVPVSQANSASTVTANFGQRPFAYTAPSGFKALCTQNLPEPTIKDGSQYFNTVLYEGDYTTSHAITGVGFQPDLVWIKDRGLTTIYTYGHRLFDAVRGAGKRLITDSTAAEVDAGTGTSSPFRSFDSDGFTVGQAYDTNEVDPVADFFVSWNWKANGSGVSNTDGTITSTVSANTDSGFSIVTFTSTSSTQSVGHGLGVAPSMIILKNRSTTSNWACYHTSLGNNNILNLNQTSAQINISNAWATSSTTFTPDQPNLIGGSGITCVAYCFAAIPGYSAFGSYTGNGSTDGPFVYTGFRPRWILMKSSTNASTPWQIFDSVRETFNTVEQSLIANGPSAEPYDTASPVDFLSNGFKLRGAGSSWNNYNTGTWIYACFAENPFKYSLAR